MTPDDQANTLERWLEEPPGSPPPAELDSEVVQAIYTLRPDLAPAPRVTADDILASLTAGPLAGKAGERASATGGAEIVPFPSTRAGGDPERAPAPVAQNRWLKWAGGGGGIGLALVAAATLLVVALPLGRQGRDEAAPSASVVVDGQGRAARQAPAAAPAEAESSGAPEPAPLDSSEPTSRAEAARPAAQAPAPPAAPPPAVLEMEDGALFRDRSVIPEVSEGLAEPLAPRAEAPSRTGAAGTGAAGAEGAGQVAAPQASYAEPTAPEKKAAAEDLDDLRSRADKAAPGSGWRKGVDAQTLARIDLAITEAQALRSGGDLRGAADRLAQVIGPPARAGQYLAWLAATDYLGAGDPAAASGVAQRGLALSTSRSPERDALLIALGDAARALGDEAAAADAYRMAK